MKHLKLDIKAASWLNETEKTKLCKALDAVRFKNVQQQGIDMLNLCPDKIYHYQQSMIGILRALSADGVREVLGSERVAEIGMHAEELHACFSVWEGKDMDTLLEIYNIYQHGNDNNKSEKIDKDTIPLSV